MAVVRTVHLSRLGLEGGDLADLARLHAEWALGVDRFAALREGRLAVGVPADLGADEIAGDTLKFSLPFPDGTTRTSLVRLSAQDGTVLVEHLVVRRGEPFRLRTPSADAPDVVTHLLADPRTQPRELAPGTCTRVADDDVAALVGRIRASERKCPLVLVSVDNGSRDPVVDPGELAGRLAGMAAVHFLASVRASHRLRDELIAAGFSEKFGCYNGGVRILWPGIVPGDDPYGHLLLLPVRLLAMPDRSRTENVAGLFCEMIAEDEDVRAWLRELEPPTRAAPAAPVRVRDRPAIVPMQPRPTIVAVPEPTPAPAREAVAEETTQAAIAPTPDRDTAPAPAIEPEPVPAPRERESPARPPTTWSKLGEDVLAALELAAELERDLEATRRDLVEARQALRRSEQQRDELAEGAMVLADVAEATNLAAARFPERLVILPSAHASALDAAYRDPERCFRVLVLLAMFGHHDGLFSDTLVKALGHAAEWKPKDSPATTSKFGMHRTWSGADGVRKLFARHVTLGGSVNPQRCLQIYYDVLADGRIEVAWIGEHRPTVGKDT